jgi:hypothetical protein
MAGHTGMVACLAFCATGRTLASGSWDCNVVVWEVKSGVPSAILKGHNGCDGCTCEVNPLAQAKLAAQCVIRGHAHFVNSLCWSADARVLISAGADGAIIFWDVSANVPLRTISGKAWRSVRLSADGALLAAAGANDLVQIWPADPDTGTFDGPLATLQGHAGAITALNFSSSGLLASASYDSSCIVWTQGVHDGSLGTAGCRLPLRVARCCPGRRASRARLREPGSAARARRRALPFRRMEARPNQAARPGSPASLAADARGGGASLSPCQDQWADALGPVRPQPLRQTIGSEQKPQIRILNSEGAS